VRSTAGVGGGFEIMKEYKVDKKVFSTADLSAILMGLSSLSGMVRGEDLVHALAKVRSFIPADRANDIELKANQICVDVSPWMGNRNIQPYLEIVKTALQERALVTFAYVNHRGTETARTIEPYQLVLKGGHWYVQGYCRTREDFRLFKLARMSNLRMREESFSPREFQKPQLDFSDALAAMQAPITLRIHASVMDRVLDFCGYENFSPDGADWYRVSFPFIENDFSYGILLSLGDRCECLEPPHVRAEMRRRIGEMAGIYEG
jgi:predicted DNA-binding transcriptional regulator YafY